SKSVALEEIRQQCSRFLSPLTMDEKIQLFFMTNLNERDLLKDTSYVVAPGIPLNWHTLLRFLHKERIIRSARADFDRRLNAAPKSYGVRLTHTIDKEYTDGTGTSGPAYASGSEIEHALSAVVGEVLERYMLSVYKLDDMPYEPYSTMQKRR